MIASDGGAGPVFVVGCDRSGTTLLRLMLDAGPDLHIPKESGFLPILRRRATRYGSFETLEQRRAFIRDLRRTRATSRTYSFDIFGLSEKEAERALANAAPLSYPGASSVLFDACARTRGKTRWGDKTPRYVEHLPWLGRSFPNAVFIHIVRDPRAVADSLRRAGWYRNPRRGARFWRERVTTGREGGQSLGPKRYLEIHYEDLVREPEETLRRVCRFAQLTYTSEMLRFFEDAEEKIPPPHAHLFERVHGPVDATRVEGWRSRLDAKEVAEIEVVAGDAMVDFGYSKVGHSLEPWRITTVSLVDAAHGLLLRGYRIVMRVVRSITDARR